VISSQNANDFIRLNLIPRGIHFRLHGEAHYPEPPLGFG
jgi:hypothetical protein